METLASVVPLGLVGGALAAALWAWQEIRDVAMGGHAGRSAPRSPDASARHPLIRRDGKLNGSA
jgi:hypothetical protein